MSVKSVVQDVLASLPDDIPWDELESRLAARRMLEEGISEKKKRSLLELRGLGKEIWEGVDPEEYVKRERDSWE